MNPLLIFGSDLAGGNKGSATVAAVAPSSPWWRWAELLDAIVRRGMILVSG